MSLSELVLCIHKKTLPADWVTSRTVLPMEFDIFMETCKKAGFEFIPRSRAETDSTLKQIIPYIVMQTSDGRKTAMYSRAGSEKRLHDLKSIGIGGHINPEDQASQHDDFSHILRTGMERELNEELAAWPAYERPVFAGIISEDLTDVGKVHLGAVFRILTDNPAVYKPGEELFEFQWVDTPRLDSYKLELWSELALELLAGD